MKRVVIIGAGGHGREVAEIIRHQSQNASGPALLGFVVDSDYLADTRDPGAPILGDWRWLETNDCADLLFICAIGDPVVRKRLVEKALSLGLVFTNAISPSAHISPHAGLGSGVMVFPHAVISTNVWLADHVAINAGATVSHDTRIERFGTIGPGVHLAGNVSIGEGSFLGIGSCVIESRTIGAWTTIGAGAVVIRNLPSQVTAVGVPATVIKSNRSA